MIVLTSWDDGHPLDMRIATLLSKYRLAGTFYVPIRNSEGYPVLSPLELRQLASEFEIGGHSLDHLRLTKLSRNEIVRQVADGKRELEQLTGGPVAGFCYPGGKLNHCVSGIVRSAGFEYARTTENFRCDMAGSEFCLPTTIQLYRHPKSTLFRNFALKGNWMSRYPTFFIAQREDSLVARISAISEHVAHNNGILHVWGHSWEIDKHGLWTDLELIFKVLSSFEPTTMTVLDCFRTKRNVS